APRSGDGRSPQRPWGACCGIRHNTRILSRPKSEACLDKIRSGGASPQPGQNRSRRHSGPHEVGTAALLSGRGGRVVAYATTPESCQGRRAKRALTRFVPGGRPPSQARTDQDGTRGPTKWGRPHSSAAVGGVLWHTPQHQNLVKAEEGTVPCQDSFGGGVPPARPEPIKTALGAPRSGDGRTPQRPWGACCGIRHNTRILSRPKSEACLDKIRSG